MNDWYAYFTGAIREFRALRAPPHEPLVRVGEALAILARAHTAAGAPPMPALAWSHMGHWFAVASRDYWTAAGIDTRLNWCDTFVVSATQRHAMRFAPGQHRGAGGCPTPIALAGVHVIGGDITHGADLAVSFRGGFICGVSVLPEATSAAEPRHDAQVYYRLVGLSERERGAIQTIGRSSPRRRTEWLVRPEQFADVITAIGETSARRCFRGSVAV